MTRPSLRRALSLLFCLACLATSSSGQMTNPGNAVDLGLSVMWGDRNVGAAAPSDVGAFFGYGDITGEIVSTKYVDYVSEDITGTDRDPANHYWGPGWRMPRTSEIAELVERCEWRWVSRGDTEGYLVTGRGGNSIFLPTTGHRTDSTLYFQKTRGYYWGGEVDEFNKNYASALFFYRGNKFVKEYRKIYGFVVRPVRESFF